MNEMLHYTLCVNPCNKSCGDRQEAPYVIFSDLMAESGFDEPVKEGFSGKTRVQTNKRGEVPTLAMSKPRVAHTSGQWEDGGSQMGK